MTYAALVRTHNSVATLPATIASLAAQSRPPARYVFVDSGSNDETLTLLPADAIIHKFEGKAFNYSDAINQGLAKIDTEYVLIVSSHTSLTNTHSLEYGLDLLGADGSVGAAYFTGDVPEHLSHQIIDRHAFDGFNGIWNTASLVRCSLLRARPFRSEVFAAEDQEWSRWLLHERRKTIARVLGSGLCNGNPRKSSHRKLINEYLAIATYANRGLLAWTNIARIGLGALKPVRRSSSDRLLKLRLCYVLTLARFFRLKVDSRYY